jgi:hypothetical protein
MTGIAGPALTGDTLAPGFTSQEARNRCSMHAGVNCRR